MKHLKSLLLSTFALYLLITVCGCGKEKIVPLYTVSPDFLSYCYFQNGSYWIYEEDSFPGSLDSVYVFFETHDTVLDYTARPKYEYERFLYGIVLRNTRWQILIINSGPDSFILQMSESDSLLNFDALHLFQFGDSDSIDGGLTKITGRFDSMVINRTVYHDLIQVTHFVNKYGNPTREILFAKGVGVVRRSFWDGTTWSLKRYHLN
jgi:hypothetical protein